MWPSIALKVSVEEEKTFPLPSYIQCLYLQIKMDKWQINRRKGLFCIHTRGSGKRSKTPKSN
jgi:hypothetical protein